MNKCMYYYDDCHLVSWYHHTVHQLKISTSVATPSELQFVWHAILCHSRSFVFYFNVVNI